MRPETRKFLVDWYVEEETRDDYDGEDKDEHHVPVIPIKEPPMFIRETTDMSDEAKMSNDEEIHIIEQYYCDSTGLGVNEDDVAPLFFMKEMVKEEPDGKK